ncbi:sensor histidine kinase [Flavobacterium sp. MC2016-06]|uniref:sensor histidine kinase n=1 Tax=Flavobacterium sp. MC2016-06 TaxID=2676308 RepID=UPI0012BB0BF6|nr:histidine kinase [Flavobacterium sp. MC2016-06]MBU3857531.1 sensor histidine kinase [Flavobacterium sp. MC2016-06]
MGKYKRIALHIAACVFFMATPIIFPTHPPEEKDFLFSVPTRRDFIANLLMLFIFYGNYYYLIKHYFISKKYFLYGLLILSGLIIVSTIPSLITGRVPLNPEIYNLNRDLNHGMPMNDLGGLGNFWNEVSHHIYLYAIVIVFSILLRVQNRMQKIENEKLFAELSHLKMQIHPHFLFNTLNSIYALSIKKDDRAAETVIKLSDFMRYLLQDSYQNEVFLEKEIDYISNYIDLQKSRLRNAVDLTYETKGDFSGKKIAPLLLFTFVENAFKYGVNPDENSVIKIGIEMIDNEIILKVFNRIVTIHSIESTNIGIKNTKERLELYYQNKHSLSIDSNPFVFSVVLKITLE